MNYPLHRFESQPASNELVQNNSTDSFFNSIEIITTVKLLCQMINAVQQHRGSTMACITGNVTYAERVSDLETAINTGFSLCQAQMARQYSPINPSMFEHAFTDWQTIQNGWRADELLENYEFHNHLIEALTKLRTDALNSLLETPSFEPDDSHLLKETMHTLLTRLPDYIEQFAKLRGLGATDSVIKASGPESLPRIHFLIKCLREENESIFDEISQCVSSGQIEITTKRLNDQKRSATRIMNRLEKKLNRKKAKVKDDETLFDDMTDIINSLWQLVDTGISSMDRKVYDLSFDWRPF